MTPIEQKAKELVDKFGHLAPDVCDELSNVACYAEISHAKKDDADIEQSVEFWQQIKSECEKLLKDRKFKSAEETLLDLLSEFALSKHEELTKDDLLKIKATDEYPILIKAMHEFAKQNKTI